MVLRKQLQGARCKILITFPCLKEIRVLGKRVMNFRFFTVQFYLLLTIIYSCLKVLADFRKRKDIALPSVLVSTNNIKQLHIIKLEICF